MIDRELPYMLLLKKFQPISYLLTVLVTAANVNFQETLTVVNKSCLEGSRKDFSVYSVSEVDSDDISSDLLSVVDTLCSCRYAYITQGFIIMMQAHTQ